MSGKSRPQIRRRPPQFSRRRFAAIPARRRQIPRPHAVIPRPHAAIPAAPPQFSPLTPSFPRRRESKMAAEKTRAKIKYKDSPFPRKRESHPKLATKEIPAFAGMTAGGGKYKFIPPAALRRGVEIRKANFRGAERDGEKAPSIPAKLAPAKAGGGNKKPESGVGKNPPNRKNPSNHAAPRQFAGANCHPPPPDGGGGYK